MGNHGFPHPAPPTVSAIVTPWRRRGRSTCAPGSPARARGDPRAPRARRRGAALDHVPGRRGRGPRRRAHRRRRQHVHRLRRRRRLPQRRPLAPATWSRPRRSSSSASRTPTTRSSRTRSTSRSPSGCSSARRSRGRRRPPSSTPAPRRSRTRSSSRASYTKRPAVIAFEGGFHGRTLMSMSLTSKTHPYKAGPRPVRARGLPRAVRATPTAGRRPPTRSPRSSAPSSTQVAAEHGRRDRDRAGAGRGRLRRRAAPSSSRACGGSATSTGSCSSSTRCRPASARTGRFFAIEHYGVEPDLITVAKSIAAGLPLSGVLGRAEIMDAPPDSAIGGTYVGNPVAQAAALAVLDVIDEEGLVERSAEIGETIRARMLAWQERWRRDRRRARARRDARDRARLRPRRRRSRRPSWRAAVVEAAPSAACCCSRAGSTATASACSSRS